MCKTSFSMTSVPRVTSTSHDFTAPWLHLFHQTSPLPHSLEDPVVYDFTVTMISTLCMTSTILSSVIASALQFYLPSKDWVAHHSVIRRCRSVSASSKVHIEMIVFTSSESSEALLKEWHLTNANSHTWGKGLLCPKASSLSFLLCHFGLWSQRNIVLKQRLVC